MFALLFQAMRDAGLTHACMRHCYSEPCHGVRPSSWKYKSLPVRGVRACWFRGCCDQFSERRLSAVVALNRDTGPELGGELQLGQIKIKTFFSLLNEISGW